MKKLLLFVLLPLAICAQHVPGTFSRGPRVAVTSSAARTPAGYSLSVEAPAAWELGPPSSRESAPIPRLGARQIGVRRAVPEGSLSSAVDFRLPDGRHVWLARLRSQGAVALRAHFRNFSIGVGQVWLYDARHASVAGPYSGRGVFGTGEFWSSSVASDEMVIEYDAPAGTSPAGLPFRIDALGHQWSAVLTPAATPRDSPDTAAVCELDVSCYTDWDKYASGVVVYTFLGDSGGYYTCSGVLLNPAGTAFAPYLLTANHCISDPHEAGSAGIIFGYTSKACMSTDVQSLGDGSATYLAGAAIGKGDYTLLTLTAPAPAGVYLFGWTTDAPAVGESLVGIHHPEGSWARISLGTRGADETIQIDGVTAPASDYYQVTFQQGVVEPGSSGSPLLNAKGEVVGTLTGELLPNTSASICDIGPVRAVYGRFATAYSNIATDLNSNLNPAPAFTISPSALVFNISDQSAPQTAYVDVTTPSLTPVPFSVKVADSWVKLDAESGLGLISPAFINSDTNVNLTVDVGDPTLMPGGTYKSSITVAVGANAPVTIPVTLNIANTQSRVIAAVNDEPFLSSSGIVLPQLPGGDTAPWRFVLTLAETAGVATKITGLRVDGQDISSRISSIFGSATIPPLGSANGEVTISGIDNSQAGLIEIDGTDVATGTGWTQSLPVTFAGPWNFGSLLVSGIPAVVYPDPDTPACPLRQHVTLQSVGDTPVTLTGLQTPTIDLSPQLTSFFESTYIPVGGSVQGDVCWSQAQGLWPEASPWFGLDQLLVTLSAIDALGNPLYNPLGVAVSGVPPIIGRLAVNKSAVNFASVTPQPVTVSVDPGSSSLSWNAVIVYDQAPAAWLSLTPSSGSGPGSMQVSVNPVGLVGGGVYHATVIIQSLNSAPQYLTIPVSFQTPATGMAVLNSASFTVGVAPGAVFSVFDPGGSLAGGTEPAGTLPLPMAMQGASVTVNNIPAPLYYVSPTQLNVQIPYEAAPGPATLAISNASGQIASQPIYVNPVAPGIFLANDRRYIAPNAAATPGGYVTLYLTGQGPVTPAVATGAAPPNPDQVPVSGLPHPYAQVQVLVNGVPAQTSFVGIPYYLVGVTQINFIVPPATPGGDQPVIVTVAGVPSNTAYIHVGS